MTTVIEALCDVCPTGHGKGWAKPNVTHCKTCHATWNLGTKVTHCVTCHETFTTHSNCDRHQVGTKDDPGWRCRPPASVGLERDARGFWKTPDTTGRFA